MNGRVERGRLAPLALMVIISNFLFVSGCLQQETPKATNITAPPTMPAPTTVPPTAPEQTQPPVAPTTPAPTVLPKIYDGPIIDVHTHLPDDLSVSKLISGLNEVMVSKAVLMPRGGAEPEAALEVYNKYPDRIIPFIGFQNKYWINQDPNFVTRVENNLKNGVYKGLGEVVTRHYSVPELQAEEYSIPADSQLMLRFIDLAAKYKVPINIHMESEDATVPQLERALGHNRGAVIIWAHAGRAEPKLLQTLLDKHSNLYVDISGMQPVRRYGREKNPIASPDGNLYQEWKNLFEAYPKRFMVGNDCVVSWHYDYYTEWMGFYRKLLGELSPATAEKIAYKNAQRLFGLQ